jgi:hypothetical protein
MPHAHSRGGRHGSDVIGNDERGEAPKDVFCTSNLMSHQKMSPEKHIQMETALKIC